jgi:hypothetical protein
MDSTITRPLLHANYKNVDNIHKGGANFQGSATTTITAITAGIYSLDVDVVD